MAASLTFVGHEALDTADAAYQGGPWRALLSMSKPVPALVPALAGAVAAVAVALLIGWPGRPPATGLAVVAAAGAIAVVAVVLVARAAAAGRRAFRPERAPAPQPAVRGSVATPPSNLVAA